MAVTATPIFAQTANVGALNAIISTAMTNTTAFDGTMAAGTAMALCYTAGANGSRIDQIQMKFASTNGATAAGTSAATLVRLWINNGSANTTAGNNIFLGEVAMPATAAKPDRFPCVALVNASHAMFGPGVSSISIVVIRKGRNSTVIIGILYTPSPDSRLRLALRVNTPI